MDSLVVKSVFTGPCVSGYVEAREGQTLYEPSMRQHRVAAYRAVRAIYLPGKRVSAGGQSYSYSSWPLESMGVWGSFLGTITTQPEPDIGPSTEPTLGPGSTV